MKVPVHVVLRNNTGCFEFYYNWWCRKATGLDQLVGLGMVALAALVFSYYTVWVIVLPFVEAEHFLHQFFLPKLFAVLVPLIGGVAVLLCLGTFVAYTMLTKKKKTN
ncbi:dolichol phosphate-mannose biosynthesis regulatory protein-like [Amphiura filiformis]|uniref:dolichol phosphate-mannose biosynthesis regulatory protein-like n=1 Tax=Amphiura filiformis TaxID=82378 RepID=UPI003B222C7A